MSDYRVTQRPTQNKKKKGVSCDHAVGGARIGTPKSTFSQEWLTWETTREDREFNGIVNLCSVSQPGSKRVSTFRQELPVPAFSCACKARMPNYIRRRTDTHCGRLTELKSEVACKRGSRGKAPERLGDL
ncbi:hypothetical protein B0H17DRAFT_1136921 [Mycena rosella]|uniref:Uncharacterized protein n=1 Tax=Mycena rosella TaxID=1033263 RepID=A0AAD7GBC6_MYCRO|nr:hypothetical protein B0H17DRAFT_1136921 [Mycena rosella]